jgi:hypothetical protein
MVDTAIETTEITETLIAIVPHVVGMRGSVIVTEGTAEIGETAEVRPPPTEVAGDTRPNTDAGEATQGAHQGEEPLVVTGSQTVREILANPQKTVLTRAGELTGKQPTLVRGPSNRPHSYNPHQKYVNYCKTDNHSITLPSLLSFL